MRMMKIKSRYRTKNIIKYMREMNAVAAKVIRVDKKVALFRLFATNI
jgi:translation initiation factor 2 alpha subunit (eIF-2alpha)